MTNFRKQAEKFDLTPIDSYLDIITGDDESTTDAMKTKFANDWGLLKRNPDYAEADKVAIFDAYGNAISSEKTVSDLDNSDKMDTVDTPTDGNLVVVDAQGQVNDAGVSLEDLPTEQDLSYFKKVYRSFEDSELGFSITQFSETDWQANGTVIITKLNDLGGAFLDIPYIHGGGTDSISRRVAKSIAYVNPATQEPAWWSIGVIGLSQGRFLCNPDTLGDETLNPVFQLLENNYVCHCHFNSDQSYKWAEIQLTTTTPEADLWQPRFVGEIYIDNDNNILTLYYRGGSEEGMWTISLNASNQYQLLLRRDDEIANLRYAYMVICGNKLESPWNVDDTSFAPDVDTEGALRLTRRGTTENTVEIGSLGYCRIPIIIY